MNKEYILNLLDNINNNVKVLAATKYYNIDEMKTLNQLGIKIFGENRVDSLLSKYDELSSIDVSWHFIGHLQKNKCKKIINKIDCLHSLDSIELAEIINKERIKPLNCFIELHLTNNNLKSGIEINEIDNFINSIKKFKNVHILGFMAMSDRDMSDEEKYQLFVIAKKLNDQYGFKELSMGMSSDYQLAIKAGATIVRLGHILNQE